MDKQSERVKFPVDFPIHPKCLEKFRDAEAALYEEEALDG